MRILWNRCIVAAAVFVFLTYIPPAVCAGERHRVKAVIDGDTLLLTDGRFVRYIGINAPEIAHKNKPAEPFGAAATRRNAELIGSGRVYLEYDRQGFDRYGRLLAYVYNDKGILVNQAMLSSGMAYCLFKSPNLRHFQGLLETQLIAMHGTKGIWGPLSRRGGRVVGNKRSKRFHRLDCRNARKISPKNKTHFTTQWQAFRSGYSPGKNCMGGMPVP